MKNSKLQLRDGEQIQIPHGSVPAPQQYFRLIASMETFLALLLHLVTQSDLCAAEINSSWKLELDRVDNNWSNSGNWLNSPSTLTYPNNGNGDFYNTTLGSGVAILTEDITVQALNLLGASVFGNFDFDFDLTANNLVTWTGGTMGIAGTLRATAGLNISGASEKFLTLGTIESTGTATWIEGEIRLNNGANFNNGALFDVQTDSQIMALDGASLFNNTGTFSKSAGASTSIQTPFSNSGTVESQSGTISFERGGIIAGTYDSTGGGTIDFAIGTYTLSGATFTGGGVRLNGANLSLGGAVNLANLALIGGTVAGTFTLTPSGSFDLAGANLIGTVGADVPFNWSAGTISGAGTQTINSGNNLTISGIVYQDTRTIANAGTTTLAGAAEHGMYNGAVFNNSGTYDIQSDGGIADIGFGFGAAPAFNNSGTLKKSGGAGTAFISVPFSNTGTVEVQSGTLSYSGGYSQTAGTTFLNGGDLSSSTTTSLNILGGTLAGSGNVNANVDNTGTIAPGASVGSLTINGNLSLASGAQMSFEIGGTIQGSKYDFVAINGAASLAGNLEVKLINDFQSSILNSGIFMVMDATSPIVGSFANVANGARLPVDAFGSFLVTYGTGPDSDKVTLSDFQPVPEPQTYAVIVSLGLLGFAACRSRLVRQPLS